MYLLGIETSCDETSASIVKDGKNILSNIVVSQIKDHAIFQGVVPEIASRKHLETINDVIEEAFHQANMDYHQINAVGVVYRPGLIGSLLIGLSTAKIFSYLYNIPLIPVNHIEAHLYAPHLEQDIPFPNIGLAISGGHTILFISRSHIEHEMIGSTIDDAVGEAFDKVAKYFNLEYPGGPIIDQYAKQGDPNAFHFPKPKFKEESPYQFSYSGLKTAVIHQLDKFHNLQYEKSLENISTCFQKTAIDMLIETSLRACKDHNIPHLVVTGGVACNSYLRSELSKITSVKTYIASPKLSTDNASMVAGLAYHLLKNNITADLSLNAFSKIVRQGKSILT